MKSIFRYPGGKSKTSVRDWILSAQPDDINEYREPFVGGGGIFFEMTGKRWINDIHSGLIAVYKALRDRPEEFITKCRRIKTHQPNDETTPSGKRNGQPKNKRMQDFFEYIKMNEDEDQALRYFYLNRTCYSGRVNYDRPSRLYFSNPNGWNIINTKRLDTAARHLRKVRITCQSYEALLHEPGQGVWIYVDPPYLVNTNLCPNDKLYQHNFTFEQHEKLAADVRQSPHKIAISYDDDKDGIIRSLYKGFNIQPNNWKYCGSCLPTKRDGAELLITNY